MKGIGCFVYAILVLGLVGPLALGGMPSAAHAADAGGHAYAEYVLESYDEDDDGALTQVEFDATGKAYFNDIDRDDDGRADAAEIAAWYVGYLQR